MISREGKSLRMKIYLIRHGETDWNHQGRLQGREDIELNVNGREQALQCGQALAGCHIKTIITSPLSRARRTAEIIGECIGARNMYVEQDLIERDYGRLSGLTYDRKKYFDTFGTKEGIEPLNELKIRLMCCISRNAILHQGEDILMVSHGAAINSVLSVLSGGELGTGKTRLKNACINKIEYNMGVFRIIHYNLTAEEFMVIEQTEG